MAIKQDVNTSLLVTVGVIAGILITVIVLGVQAWYLYVSEQETVAKTAMIEEAARKDPQLRTLWQQLSGEQTMRLNTSTPASGDTPARISIDRAIELLVQHEGKVPGSAAANPRPATEAAAQ